MLRFGGDILPRVTKPPEQALETRRYDP